LGASHLSLPLEDAVEFYRAWVTAAADEADERARRRELAQTDLFYLLVYVLRRQDLVHPWLFARCREVQASPDGHLDLWAREHGKTSIISIGLTIQDILKDRELTVGIFSHTRPAAKKILFPIKREFETNADLIALFPDVLFANPKTESPRWTDEAIIVRREGNPKEGTLEAWGLVDGMPTGSHFRLRVYDDVVTKESVTTAEMVKKTTTAWELSDNLGTEGGRVRYIGTRYLLADTYATMMERGVVKPRIYPATHNGRLDGHPVLLSPETWAEKKRTQATTIAAQMLQNPAAGNEATFELGWLRQYEILPELMNVYILADPSKGRTQRNDRTAIVVVGVDGANKRYLLDGYRHRMSLPERWEALKGLHKRWSNHRNVATVSVGYERYGAQTDDEHFAEKMRTEGYSFHIEELSWPREGGHSKLDRIERLVPDLIAGDWLFPCVVWHETHGVAHWKVADPNADEPPKEPIIFSPSSLTRAQRMMVETEQPGRLIRPIKRTDENGNAYDLTRDLIEEMMFIPFASHDDGMDALSRLYDMEPSAPVAVGRRSFEPQAFVDGV